MTKLTAGNEDNNEPKPAEGAEKEVSAETPTEQQTPAAEQDNKPVAVAAPAAEEAKADDDETLTGAKPEAPVESADDKVAETAATRPLAGDALQTEETEAAPAKKKGWLGFIFNAACCGGAGFVVGTAVKLSMVAVFGSPLAAVAVGAVAIGIASTSVQRLLDIREHNKTAETKLHWRKDFTNFKATDTTFGSYVRRAALGTVFAGVGGYIGLEYGDKIAALLGFGPDAAAPAVTTPDPIVTTPDVEVPGTTLPEVDKLPVVVTPDVPEVNVPLPDGSTDIATKPPAIIGDGTVTPPDVSITPDTVPEVIVTPDTTPEVIVTPDTTPEVIPDTVPETTPEVTPDAVPVPSLDSRVQDAMKEVYQNLPAKPGSKLAEALARTTSENAAVKAQALKDLGYFFANGFSRVAENDALANKLFELSIEVSGGNNHQALHDLGYQLTYGKGAAADVLRGRELLESAADKGNKLSIAMLKQLPALKP